jgi:hypothetical protein
VRRERTAKSAATARRVHDWCMVPIQCTDELSGASLGSPDRP